MTPRRSLRVSAFILAALAVALPSAAAHGPGLPREIDHRVLVDGTDPNDTDYGSVAEEAGQPMLYEGGHDILVLDIREARDPATGDAVLWFRIVNQAGDPTRGVLKEVLSFEVDGIPHEASFETADNIVYSGTGFDQFANIDVGDEFVTGAEGGFRFATLGLTSGSTVSDIHVQGYIGETKTDLMPGTYYEHGVLVSSEATPPAGADYVLQGPAQLVAASVEPATFDGPTVGWSADLQSRLSALTQFVGLVPAAPLTVAQPGVLLGPGDLRRASFGANLADAWDRPLVATYSVDLGDQGTLNFTFDPAKLPTDDVLDVDQLGLEDGTLGRGERYAYRFDTAGSFALAVGDEILTINVTSSSAAPKTVVQPVPRATGIELDAGDTLLLVNLAQESVEVRPVTSASSADEGSPSVSALVLLVAVATVAVVSRRHGA